MRVTNWILGGLVFAACALVVSAPAHGSPISIDYTDVVNGTLPDGVTAQTAPGNPQAKCAGSGGDQICGVGVTGGRTPGEIDVGQSLTLNFDNAVTLDELRIALLYVGPAWGDPLVNGYGERARFTATLSDDSLIEVTFQVAADGISGLLTGAGSYASCSSNPANLQSSGGCWDFTGIFGDAQIRKLVFTADSVVTSGNDSDYVFVGLTARAVPAPGALLLLGTGLLGFAMLRRRRAA